MRRGDFHPTQNRSESPSDVIKFFYELLNSTTTPCGLASVRFERFLTSKFKTKSQLSHDRYIELQHVKICITTLFSFSHSFHNQDSFSLYFLNQNLSVFHCYYGSLCASIAGFTLHCSNLLKVQFELILCISFVTKKPPVLNVWQIFKQNWELLNSR